MLWVGISWISQSPFAVARSQTVRQRRSLRFICSPGLFSGFLEPRASHLLPQLPAIG